jgi:tetratricopeptide (TPR) repeat protein
VNRKIQKPTIGFLLVITGLVAFWHVTECGFLNYDDTTYVTENGAIQEGLTLDGFLWAFTTFEGSNWHPVTWLSHMADIQFFGLEPAGHHLVNLLFHLANSVLLFHVLHRMTKAIWQSALVAALFAVHPLHVESVAWVAERKDLLGAFFGLLAVSAYVSYTERESRKHYSALVMFFSLSLLSKPMLVTLPFVLLLLDFWPLQRLPPTEPAAAGRPARSWRAVAPLIIEKIPLFLLAIASCGVTYFSQQMGGAVKSLQSFPLDVRLGSSLAAYAIYIKQTVLPLELAVLYPHPGAPPTWQLVLAATLLVTITGWVIRRAAAHPFLATGWFWYVGTLVPVIGIVQVGVQAHADRYTYLPSVGLFIMLAWGAPRLIPQRSFRRAGFWAFAALGLSFLIILTRIQVGYWKDSIRLYDHALSITRSNFVIHNNRGDAFAKIGEDRRAIDDFSRAIEINPGYSQAYFNRGSVLARRGHYREAIDDFSRAIELHSGFAEAYYNRARLLARLGQTEQALRDLARAIEIDPRNAAAFYNRGTIYGGLGEDRKALADFNRAVEINPRHARAYHNRGVAHLRLGSERQAIEDIKRAAGLGYDEARRFLSSRGLDW